MYFNFFLAALARAMFFIRCFDLFLFIFLLILLFIFLYKQKKKQNSRLVRFGRWVGHTQCIWSSSLLSAVLSDYFDIWTDFMYIIIIFALFIFILFCSVIVYTVAWPYCNTAIDSDYFFCSCCCCSKTSRRWDNAASYISIALNNFYGTIAVSVWIIRNYSRTIVGANEFVQMYILIHTHTQRIKLLQFWRIIIDVTNH